MNVTARIEEVIATLLLQDIHHLLKGAVVGMDGHGPGLRKKGERAQ